MMHKILNANPKIRFLGARQFSGISGEFTDMAEAIDFWALEEGLSRFYELAFRKGQYLIRRLYICTMHYSTGRNSIVREAKTFCKNGVR
jgi:hypothetical protein